MDEVKRHTNHVTRVGIDLGSAYLKIAVLSPDGVPEHSVYEPHFGEPLERLRTFFAQELDADRFILAYTGFYSGLLADVLGFEAEDPVRSLIAAVRAAAPDCLNIIDVGAKGARLIELADGRFKHFSHNSLCAAGTGSFLDQQIQRLELSYKDVAAYPLIENPPRIAARCSVFAKTDLIHRQHEGYSKPQMWNGLCRGMAVNLVQTLLRGRPLKGEAVLTGGVGLNSWVVHWLKHDLGKLTLHPAPHLASAIGAALVSEEIVQRDSLRLKRTAAKTEGLPTRPPLRLERSTYPSFETLKAYVDEQGTEVRIAKKPSSNRFYLGIDIGSTSTKAVLVDANGEIVADFYRKTLGDPLQATSFIFQAIGKFASQSNLEPEIIGAATTGSGRRIVGLVIGADVIINEITAHARGALRLDPDIRTIFEIGGQDSKFTRLEQGNIIESNLNYICAAGTGSFVEEQAAKLGIPLGDVGEVALGREAPYTSDRCTVFMEEDVERLLAKGYKKEEAMAAVLYSVVQNYLTKVVENRPVKEKIAFQGATARNVGLVAAFENYLGAEILVSPYCHVLGAYGAALIAAKRTEGKSRFRGLDLYKRRIELSSEECPYCANHCTITFAQIEGDSAESSARPSWGYACGKEPEEKRKRRDENYALFEKRLEFLMEGEEGEEGEHIESNKTVGIPMVLGFYTYLPFWRGFFNRLGCKVVTTGKTDEEVIEEGGKLSSADFCLPVKVVYGHFAKLVKMKPDFILLPHMLIMGQGDYYSYVCPYGQMFPCLLPSIPGYQKDKVISPMIDLTWAKKENLEELYAAIGTKLGVSRADIKKAWNAGWEAYDRFRKRCQEEGRKALQALVGKGIVVLGRPYSLYDGKVSANLALEIAKTLKVPVFPPDFIPGDDSIRWQEHRMFWDYGQTILNALEYTSEHENLFSIYVTHFACGPDSCLITLAEKVMKGKPFMILEVDEHSSAGGYTTRIEAFSESIESHRPAPRPSFDLPRWGKVIPDYSDRKVWIPPMHPVGSRLFASVFRRHGINAEALPPTDRIAMNIGKSLTLGKECLPAVVTIGTLVKKLREDRLDPARQAFFMPSSEGPCRFGQYVNLHRIILDRQGYKDLFIINPSSYNSYAGLTRSIQMDLWEATLYSDFLTKLRCKIKPYETNPGQTRRLFEKSIRRMEKAIEEGNDERIFRKIVDEFRAIPIDENGNKPLIGIVGEIYVRCDPFSNEGVIEFIEAEGGEVWMAPASEFLAYTNYSRMVRAARQKNTKSLLAGKVTSWLTRRGEHRLYKITGDLLGDRIEPSLDEIRQRSERYMPFECGTEAVLTLGRAIIFARDNGASVVVNVSPFTCMPGTYTSAVFERIQADYGVPVVSMFYDGEEGTNEELGVYLRNLASPTTSSNQ